MTKSKIFDPDLTFAEIARVYDFTTWFLEKLGMSMWRLAIQDRPCDKDSYATILPLDDKHIGELALHPNWEVIDLEAERIPTLIHECLHLTHRQLTDLVHGKMPKMVAPSLWFELEQEWKSAIEFWTDHLTQVVLGAYAPEIELKAAEIWGEDWKETGSSRAGDRHRG